MAVLAPAGSGLSAATRLSGPPTWGSPDQPFGTRRAVTPADQARIAAYRSRTPLYPTRFSTADALQSDRRSIVDDPAGLKSCRRAGNVEASDAGARFRTLVATDCHAHWSTGSIVSKAQHDHGC